MWFSMDNVMKKTSTQLRASLLKIIYVKRAVKNHSKNTLFHFTQISMQILRGITKAWIWVRYDRSNERSINMKQNVWINARTLEAANNVNTLTSLLDDTLNVIIPTHIFRKKYSEDLNSVPNGNGLTGRIKNRWTTEGTLSDKIGNRTLWEIQFQTFVLRPSDDIA